MKAHVRRMQRVSTIMTELTSERNEASDDFRVILQLVDAAVTDMKRRGRKACLSICALRFDSDNYTVSLG